MSSLPTAEEIRERLCREVFGQPLISNNFRALYVEYMLALRLEPEWRYVGQDWQGWDFEHIGRGVRMEVKQSARRQTWSRDKGDRPAALSFDISPRTGYWEDAVTWCSFEERQRLAEIYVFAAHEGFDPPAAVDHRDPAQWRFLVLPASALPARQKTIALSRVLALGARESDLSGLPDVLAKVMERIA